jgi:uncharacterized membrane protein YGL010W
MALITLNRQWSELMDRYADDHQDPRNQAFHKVGIPLIVGSLPVGATIVGLPVAAGMFAVGWAFQFAGHYFEGKKPSFVSDKRQLVVGVLWWCRKMGIPLTANAPQAAADADDDAPRPTAVH